MRTVPLSTFFFELILSGSGELFRNAGVNKNEGEIRNLLSFIQQNDFL